MRINDIQYAETGKTRTDGRYPQRIGSEVEFYTKPEVGACMYLQYVSDNQGNPRDGVLRTSTVQAIFENNGFIHKVLTRNSIFVFE